MLLLLNRFAGEVHAELLEYLPIDFGQHHRSMYLTAFELRKGGQGFFASFVTLAEYTQSNEDLIGMQTWIAAFQKFHLRLLDRLYHLLWYEFHIVIYTGKIFCGIEKEGCRGTEKWC